MVEKLKFSWKNVDVEAVFFMVGLTFWLLGFVLLYVFLASGVDIIHTTKIPIVANPIFLFISGGALISVKFVKWGF